MYSKKLVFSFILELVDSISFFTSKASSIDVPPTKNIPSPKLAVMSLGL